MPAFFLGKLQDAIESAKHLTAPNRRSLMKNISRYGQPILNASSNPEISSSSPEALKQVNKIWSEQAGSWAGKGLHWLEHAAVQKRINTMVSGSTDLDRFQYFIHKYFPGKKPVQRVLTLGCGIGELERGLAQIGFASEYEAVDIAEGAISKAIQAAKEQNFAQIKYRVGDLNRLVLQADHYDVIFGVSSIHHVFSLESLFQEVRVGLKPGGYFFLDEYIGASQYQWPDEQVDAINRTLELLPAELRRSITRRAELKSSVARPTIEAMNEGDPSEAIRSAEIVPLLKKYFELLELRGYGGGLLQMLLDDITGNFREGDPSAEAWLLRLFEIEDELTTTGRLRHDFAVLIARKPTRKPTRWQSLTERLFRRR